jgi:hypothetical protein
MAKKNILSISLILISLIAIYLVLMSKPVAEAPNISSFEECVAAGNPVMESYPEQCRTEDGTLFVRDIADTE